MGHLLYVTVRLSLNGVLWVHHLQDKDRESGAMPVMQQASTNHKWSLHLPWKLIWEMWNDIMLVGIEGRSKMDDLD